MNRRHFVKHLLGTSAWALPAFSLTSSLRAQARQLSRDRKAAILIVLLGEQVSGSLFKHLSRREVARIAREVAELGAIEPAMAERVLEDYYLDALNGPPEKGGPEMARRILAQASISEDIEAQAPFIVGLDMAHID